MPALGEDEDFGIKYNVSNGGPAPEGVTSQVAFVSPRDACMTVAGQTQSRFTMIDHLWVNELHLVK